MIDPFALIVLAKAPVPGRVKTRLCPPATPEQAADLAASALLDTLAAAVVTPSARLVVALAGDIQDGARSDALAAALTCPVIPQRGVGLGPRIAAAHADAAVLLPGLATLQVGMDTPQIDPDVLADCADRLRHADAVLGPADDGGWWLLGLRDPRAAALIAGVPTSRPDTGAATVRALRQGGLRVAVGPQLRDVDTVADAVEVAHLAPRTAFAAAVHELVAVPAR